MELEDSCLFEDGYSLLMRLRSQRTDGVSDFLKKQCAYGLLQPLASNDQISCRLQNRSQSPLQHLVTASPIPKLTIIPAYSLLIRS
jgi:hypothetical protein